MISGSGRQQERYHRVLVDGSKFRLTIAEERNTYSGETKTGGPSSHRKVGLFGSFQEKTQQMATPRALRILPSAAK